MFIPHFDQFLLHKTICQVHLWQWNLNMFVQEFLAKGGISNGMGPSEENFAHDVKDDGGRLV